MSMRIGIDASRALRAEQTGTERYSREIIRHLLKLPTSGQQHWVLYADGADASALETLSTPEPRVNVSWQSLPNRRMWTHRALARAARRDNLDVLFIPAHVVPFVLPPARLPPSVVTIHDLGYHFFPMLHTHTQRAYLEWSTRWNVHAAAQVICVSRSTADDVQSVYGVDRDKIRVVHEALPTAAAGLTEHLPQPNQPDPVTSPAARDSEPALAVLAADTGIPELASSVGREYHDRNPAMLPLVQTVQGFLPGFTSGRRYALYVGTIQPRKNLIRVISAFDRISKRVSWDLVLAGRAGWKSEAIYRHAGATASSTRIHFLGYTPDATVLELQRHAHFFCFPSLYEGFGLPILEAQTQGVPVLTSNNSSLPEIAGDAALLVDPTDVDAIADAMLQISTDETLRAQLVAAGYENVKRFSWEKAAR